MSCFQGRPMRISWFQFRVITNTSLSLHRSKALKSRLGATILSTNISNKRLFITSQNRFKTGETITGSTSGATAKIGKYRANPIQNIQQLLNYADSDTTISDFLSEMRKSQFQNNITIKGYKAFAFPTMQQETKSSQRGVETKFVVTFSLHRETSGYLIRYHLVCAVLVFIRSISFYIEPKIVPGK